MVGMCVGSAIVGGRVSRAEGSYGGAARWLMKSHAARGQCMLRIAQLVALEAASFVCGVCGQGLVQRRQFDDGRTMTKGRRCGGNKKAPCTHTRAVSSPRDVAAWKGCPVHVWRWWTCVMVASEHAKRRAFGVARCDDGPRLSCGRRGPSSILHRGVCMCFIHQLSCAGC